MRIRIAIAFCLTVTAICVGVALARTPLVVAGSDGTPVAGEIGDTRLPTTICQPEETMPQGTTAIRVSMLSLLGPRLKLRASTAAGVLVTSGELSSGWTGNVVAIPVARVARTYMHVTICISLAKRQQLVNLRGTNTSVGQASQGIQRLPGRLRFEYLRPANSSWLSLVRSTARRIGLVIGGGAGIVAIPFLLLLTCTVLMSRQLVRDLR